MACGLCIFRKLLTRGEDLFVVPALLILLQGPVEGGKLALDDQLSDNRLVPILRSCIDPLRDERSKIDSVIVLASG